MITAGGRSAYHWTLQIQTKVSSARYIADLNPDIPYSLLAFYPHLYLQDLPTTARTHALRCKEVAERQGLCRVHVGNIHLLGEDY